MEDLGYQTNGCEFDLVTGEKHWRTWQKRWGGGTGTGFHDFNRNPYEDGIQYYSILKGKMLTKYSKIKVNQQWVYWVNIFYENIPITSDSVLFQ